MNSAARSPPVDQGVDRAYLDAEQACRHGGADPLVAGHLPQLGHMRHDVSAVDPIPHGEDIRAGRLRDRCRSRRGLIGFAASENERHHEQHKASHAGHSPTTARPVCGPEFCQRLSGIRGHSGHRTL